MSIQDDIATLRKEIDQKRTEADKLQRLDEAFPGIEKQTGRWNKVAYCSEAVNGRVDRFDMRHNCGCCNDSPLEVWPYLETPDGNVYSKPAKFVVGERDPLYGGDIPNKGWDEKMREAGIAEAVIGAVRIYFRKQADEVKEAAERIYGEEP
jgi:hypothetical protein